MPPSSAPEAHAEHRAEASAATGWSEALGALMSSRLALMHLESCTAARQAGQLAACIAAAAIALICAWALLVAGGIAALAAATAWPWYWLALAAAVAHALAAGYCLLRARTSYSPVFPVTRAEFIKDREWLATLKSPRKSNN
ncbi:MAG: phage holin family protein [Verrucomicrobiota bacterium]